jgi:hypothetical protein
MFKKRPSSADDILDGKEPSADHHAFAEERFLCPNYAPIAMWILGADGNGARLMRSFFGIVNQPWNWHIFGSAPHSSTSGSCHVHSRTQA